MLLEFWLHYRMDFFISLLGILAIAILLAPRYLQRYRRERLRHQAVPRHWRQYLRHQWPQYRHLPANIQLKLGKQIQRFLAEVEFVGCNGLQVTEPMKLLIAAQACLLTVNLPVNDYPGLTQVLIYPDAFQVNLTQTDAAGVVSNSKQWRQGESWQQGQVILSWKHTLAGAELAFDGRNLIFHEFAHQLDQQTGQVNGMPLVPSELQARWSETMNRHFLQLQQQLAVQSSSWIDAYAATAPAEFFAVLTEIFFEMPAYLFDVKPEIYQLFAEFFQLDPLHWH